MTTAAVTDGLAARLAGALLAIEGVQDLFPKRPTAAALLTLVGAGPPTPADLVEVDVRGTALHVSARLATSRTVPSRTIIERALTAVRETTDPRVPVIEIELAYID